MSYAKPCAVPLVERFDGFELVLAQRSTKSADHVVPRPPAFAGCVEQATRCITGVKHRTIYDCLLCETGLP